MAKGYERRIAAIESDLDKAYRLILSGKTKRIGTGRDIIEAYAAVGRSFIALTLVERTKRWLANDEDTKSSTFLDRTIADAMPFGDENATWQELAWSARALRYGGRFRRAQKRFKRAIKLMGPALESALADDPLKAADVLADFAEFWAYLGYPDRSDRILNKIPIELTNGWILWVMAFVEHQRAFTTVNEFGLAVAPGSLGAIDRYELANDLLDQARPGLTPEEAADSELLRAANWGGIYRNRKADKAGKAELDQLQANAEAALDAFRNSTYSAPVNKEWSWQKERRGLIPPRFIEEIDDEKFDSKLGRKKVGDWRSALADHFRLNLKLAGLEQSSSSSNSKLKDGNTPASGDPGDDDGD